MASSNQSAPQDRVTGSAGALTSKPEISAGHSIAKAFLPHQRVTTEGKAMACKCFSEVKERMEARIKEALGDSIHSMDECDFGSRVWVLAEGDYCQVMLPFNVRYRKRKKNGDPEQRLTNSDTKIAINYCPFCGTKFEGKAA